MVSSSSSLLHLRSGARANIIDTFIQLADGKLNGQKAFMTGALKVKGNVMLAVSLTHFDIQVSMADER
jgi:putative sterol carrier protein